MNKIVLLCYWLYLVRFLDLYNKGIYDIHIDLLGIPMMEAAASVKARFIAARHIMSTPVQVLPIQARVKDVLDILKRTSHNAFPGKIATAERIFLRTGISISIPLCKFVKETAMK